GVLGVTDVFLDYEVPSYTEDSVLIGLITQLSLRNILPRDPSPLIFTCPTLFRSRVHRVLQFQDLALSVHSDLLRQITEGNRGRHLRDIADLACNVGDLEVHVVGLVPPGTGDPAHLGLTTQLALSTHLPGDPSHLI